MAIFRTLYYSDVTIGVGGRITIPQGIRDDLRIDAGDTLTVRIEEAPNNTVCIQVLDGDLAKSGAQHDLHSAECGPQRRFADAAPVPILDGVAEADRSRRESDAQTVRRGDILGRGVPGHAGRGYEGDRNYEFA